MDAAGGQADGAVADPAGDLAAITRVIFTYAAHIRNANGAACADLFAADASFEMLDLNPTDFSRRLRSRLEGRDAIIAHIAGASRPDMRVFPLIHNPIVTIDGDTARSTCAMTAITVPVGDDLLGEYHDEFRREGGAWRFISRQHTNFLHRRSGTAA